MPLPPEIVEERKNGLINNLTDQYSRSQFTLEEYERLVEYANKIETSKEIALLGRMLRENGAGEAARPDDAPRYGPAADSRGAAEFSRGFQGRHFAILSSRRIESLPAEPEDRDFLSILGDCQVWVNENDLTEDVTVINANTLLGEVVIHVPDNVTVENRVLPILGDAGVKKKRRGFGRDHDPAPASPWNRKIIVTGTAILGNITVKYGK